MHFISEHLVRDKRTDMYPSHIEPHFNNERFRQAGTTVTVYLAPDLILEEGADTIPDLHYVYSDALYVEEDVWERAEDAAGSHTNVTFFELYAAAAMGLDAVDIAHILAGVHGISGKAYQVFGLASSESEPIETEGEVEPVNISAPQ